MHAQCSWLRVLCLCSGIYFSAGFLAHRYSAPLPRHRSLALKATQQEDYFLPLALKPYPLNLWVRRCGQLGEKVLDRWRNDNPASTAVVELQRRHNLAYNRKCHPRYPDEAKLYYGACDSVLFGISPALNKNETVPFAEESLKLWNRKGRMIMISSTSHYIQPSADFIQAADAAAASSARDPEGSDQQLESEQTQPVIERYVNLNESAAVVEDCDITRAERLILNAGGIVVRLAGLFGGKKRDHDERGPSTWLAKPAVHLHPNDTISLIHYDDAATLITTVLQHGTPGAIYLGSANSLTASRAAEAIRRSYKWRNKPPPNFVRPTRTLFAGLDDSWTMRKLHVRTNVDFVEHMETLMW